MGLVVNLDEFSELCGRTAETMRDYIRSVEGEPAWLLDDEQPATSTRAATRRRNGDRRMWWSFTVE